MSSTLGQSSTADAIDSDSMFDRYSVANNNRRSKDGERGNNDSVSFRHPSVVSESRYSITNKNHPSNDGEGSNHDSVSFHPLSVASESRYSLTNKNRPSKDGEGSNHNSVSFRHLSGASESSYSGTYGASYNSDGSETLERDEFDEFGDIDSLSLESQPMIIDRWVDSTCSCLDYPVLLYQTMCLGTETSLLRQSKCRPLPRSTAHRNPTPSVTKRRSNLKHKVILEKHEFDDTESSMEDEKNNDMKHMRIQPEKDFEFDDSEEHKRKRNDIQIRHKKEKGELLAVNDSEIDKPSRRGPTTNEEGQSISNVSTKSMLERAIKTVAKEDEEREINTHNSDTTSKELDGKIDPPSDTQFKGHTESYSENNSKLELSASNSASESLSKEEKPVQAAEDPSGRSQRSPSPTILKEMDGEEGPQRRSHPSQKQEETIINDENSLSSNVEIIDVISIDDQDSWTPGSRNDTEHSKTRIRDDRHHNSLKASRPNNSRSVVPLSTSKTHHQHDKRPATTDSSSVDELWIEEETKLKMGELLKGASSLTSKDLVVAKSAEELWNEERVKLMTTSEDIFQDPNAREAFLGLRQVRLHQDNVIDDSKIIRPQSRRQKMEKARRGRGREDPLSNKLRTKHSRSPSIGRTRPSPEIISVISQSRSESRERGLVSKVSGDSLKFAPLSTRKKDLVVVRSIDEGQRIRSSRRDATKYNFIHHMSSANTPIDVRGYARESSSRGPYDEHSNPSQQNPKIDSTMKLPPRQRTKSRDPVGRKGIQNAREDQVGNYLLNDERDDQESLPSIPPMKSRPTTAPVEKSWSDYDTAVSATKELRQLEKKIERQLKRADLESEIEESKELRRMEKKLSKRLRSIMKAESANAQKMSSREIRKLEKHLTQTLKIENENRASKLKRIKLKGVPASRGPTSPSNKIKEDQTQMPSSDQARRSQGHESSPSPPGKPFSQQSQAIPLDGSRFEHSKSLRSRYARRAMGRRSYSKMPETD